jgi:hypothetical protein
MDHDHDSVSRRGVWGSLGHLDARRAPRRTQRPGRLVPTDSPSAPVPPIRNLYLAIRHLLRRDSGKPFPAATSTPEVLIQVGPVSWYGRSPKFSRHSAFVRSRPAILQAKSMA